MSSAPPTATYDPEDTVGLGRLTGFIGFRLRRIQNLLSKRFSDRTQEYGLRSGALSALAIIEDNPGISQSQVAREIGMDSSAAVALLDELEQRDWIKRKRLAKDRRRYAIYLSPEGIRVLDDLFSVLGQTEDAVLRALSSNELIMLNRALDKIYAECFRSNEE